MAYKEFAHDHHTPMRLSNLMIVLMALVLAGCASLRPLESKPPASAIVLKSPVTVRELFSKEIFPAGEYRPLYEDDHGFYFQAPAKIVANDIISYMYDGGLYVQRGDNAPTKWYIVFQNGQKQMGTFKTIPPFELVP